MDRAQSITTIDALGDRRRTPRAFLLLLSAPVLVTKAKSGSPALLMKLACLGRNDRMRDEVANESDLRFGVLRCSHLPFFLFLQD
jgi:hypothetical protein